MTNPNKIGSLKEAAQDRQSSQQSASQPSKQSARDGTLESAKDATLESATSGTHKSARQQRDRQTRQVSRNRKSRQQRRAARRETVPDGIPPDVRETFRERGITGEIYSGGEKVGTIEEAVTETEARVREQQQQSTRDRRRRGSESVGGPPVQPAFEPLAPVSPLSDQGPAELALGIDDPAAVERRDRGVLNLEGNPFFEEGYR